MTATAPLDVLIVDDSAAIRKILQRVLRQTDLNLGEIKEAGDGTEAVEILKDRTFGLILSDINMPQMDGLQLLARIKEMDHLKNVPVIMITTEGGQGKVMEAVQLGATGYVRKPFTPAFSSRAGPCVTGLRPTFGLSPAGANGRGRPSSRGSTCRPS